MKNKYNFIAVAALLTSSLFAQEQRKIIPCYTDEAIKHYRLTHPQEAAQDDIERSKSTVTPEYAARQAGGNSVQSPTPYVLDTIPIVFHILHQGGVENVSDAVIRGAVAEINRVYTKSTSDSASIDPFMAAAEGKVNYIFQLATKDPSGNCTNGIIRHFDTNTDWDQSTYANYIYTWNRAKYVNVYVVREICQGAAPCSQTGGIIVGYTNGIGGTGSTSIDAIVYNSSFLTGTNARSLAHELGHHLSLPHTFGNTNTPGTCLASGQSDDFLASANPAAATTGVVDDTPKYAGAFSTCPAGSPNACDVSNHANVQNIMDYSSCPLNFTNGQAKRIHNLLGSTYASRSTLISAATKVSSGLRNPSICAPVANFHASTLVACTGTPITFSDSSANAIVTTWHWNFPGGTMVGGSTVNDSMPKVSYAAAGTYAVSYTATTSGGTDNITKNSYVTINSNVASYAAYTESFETATLPGTDWAVSSTLGTDWAINSTAAATGSKSAYIDNFSNTANDVSHLVSPSFNISGFTSPKFSFKMVYQQQVSSNTDKLQVLTSTDCEASWTSRWARTGAALANVTPASGFPLAPTSGQFVTYTVNIGALAGSTNVRFKFDFTAGAGGPGNYIFIDDINVYDAAIGIQAFETKIGLDIYPNPSSGIVNIDFALSEKHNVAVAVTDLLGRTVESIPSKQYAAGDVKLALAEKTTYAPGVYLVNLNIDGNVISKKVIIK